VLDAMHQTTYSTCSRGGCEGQQRTSICVLKISAEQVLERESFRSLHNIVKHPISTELPFTDSLHPSLPHTLGKFQGKNNL
jgi:hypothetical protein